MDLNVYRRMMDRDSYEPFFTKEFIFFYGQRFIYVLTNSGYFSFVFFDVTFCILMFFAFRNFHLPLYSYFCIFLFLPFFFGSQNIIRQNYAAQLVMFAISLNGTARTSALLVTSAFVHNIAALFFVLLANTKLRFFMACGFLFGSLQVIIIFYSTKVSIDTGLDFSTILVIATLLVLLVILRYESATSKFYIYVQFLLILSLSTLLSTGNLERVCYFVLLINYPKIILAIDRFAPSQFPRLVFVFLNSCVIFFSPAPRLFLF